jgi:hypothetical protein
LLHSLIQLNLFASQFANYVYSKIIRFPCQIEKIFTSTPSYPALLTPPSLLGGRAGDGANRIRAYYSIKQPFLSTLAKRTGLSPAPLLKERGIEQPESPATSAPIMTGRPALLTPPSLLGEGLGMGPMESGLTTPSSNLSYQLWPERTGLSPDPSPEGEGN